jgi:hypothetical protein
LARKLHVKTSLYVKMWMCNFGLLPIWISLLSLSFLTCTLPQVDFTQPPCSQ